jgi:mannose-6-phosphate isomerase-like protein (cupin superfamily)
MRLPLPLLSLVVVGLSVPAFAQPAPTPAPPAQPTPAAPAAGAQTPRPRAATVTSNATITVTVTDGSGLPVPGVHVMASGAMDRDGTTINNGVVRFLNLKSGDYRLRFAHDRFVLLERDVPVRGASVNVDVMLSKAPDRPADTPPPPVPAASVTPNNAPAGDPRTVAVVDYVEKNFIRGGDPLKEDQLGCTASAKTLLLQLRDPLPEHANPDADEVLYVVAGEGTLRLGNRNVPLSATTLAIVPRGTVRGLSRKGRNPLILLSTVSGPACTK